MDRKTLIKQAILTAGNVIKETKPESNIVQKEGRANFATAADLASEKTIVELIKHHFPEDDILSEESYESVTEPLSRPHLWIIDPIDGTNNFRSDRAYSAVSIGYAEKGEIQLGAIYDFDRDQLFFAEKGKGSFLNNQLISIGKEQNLSSATIATDNSYDPKGTKRNVELLLKIDPIPFVLMRGSAALMFADIAAGRMDLYFHTALKPWDNVAGFLLVTEADGVITDLEGKQITFLSSEIIAGNKELVDQAAKAFIKQ